MRVTVLVALVFVSPLSAFADDFHIEFTASYWPLSPSGTIRTSSTPVDLRSDLGIDGRKNQGMFRVVLKPGSKHRINFEVIPYRLSGANVINRTFELGGRTYPVQERISSEANVDYVFGGYQYDVVNNARGHAGLELGVAYFGATASVVGETSGLTSSEERKVPLPLAGGEFRVFPAPTANIVNINGEVKGMSFGSYGYYIQANIAAGIAVVRFLRLQAGFNWVEADVHKDDRSEGFKLRFAGPIFSLQLHN
jgi:hypothetical protein